MRRHSDDQDVKHDAQIWLVAHAEHLTRSCVSCAERWPDQAALAGKSKRKASQLDTDSPVTAKRRPAGASSSPPGDPDQAANQQAQTLATQRDDSSLLNDTVGAIFVDSAGMDEICLSCLSVCRSVCLPVCLSVCL